MSTGLPSFTYSMMTLLEKTEEKCMCNRETNGDTIDQHIFAHKHLIVSKKMLINGTSISFPITHMIY